MKKKKRLQHRGSQKLLQRACEIIRDGVILDLGSGRYRVLSQTEPDMFYDVTLTVDSCWRCSCAYHLKRKGSMCKHIIAVRKLTEHIGTVQPKKREISDVPEIICDRCKSRNCKYRETRRKKHGTSVMYKCQNPKCGKKFVHAPGFKGRHHEPEIITDALHQTSAGMSPESVARGFEKNGRHVNSSTIYRWMKDYGRILKGFADKMVAPRTGKEWCADELHFLAMGESAWVFGVMDTNSRMIIDHDSSHTKLGYNATGLFENAVRLAGKKPDLLTTDKLNGFINGFKNAIYKKKSGKHRPIHRKDAGVSKIHMNNNYERFNGLLKELLQRARGFRSRRPALLVLFLAYYNLFRPHSGIGKKTPARALGVVIRGTDKWKTVIQYTASYL